MMSGWIGVDLDGTLAHYEGWKGETHIGDPVPAMLERVKGWLARGQEVRIFTARVSNIGGMNLDGTVRDGEAVTNAIAEWCQKHLGCDLQITCIKDYGMIELWDDRAVQVIPNTGRRADGMF